MFRREDLEPLLETLNLMKSQVGQGVQQGSINQTQKKAIQVVLPNQKDNPFLSYGQEWSVLMITVRKRSNVTL